MGTWFLQTKGLSWCKTVSDIIPQKKTWNKFELWGSSTVEKIEVWGRGTLKKAGLAFFLGYYIKIGLWGWKTKKKVKKEARKSKKRRNTLKKEVLLFLDITSPQFVGMENWRKGDFLRLKVWARNTLKKGSLKSCFFEMYDSQQFSTKSWAKFTNCGDVIPLKKQVYIRRNIRMSHKTTHEETPLQAVQTFMTIFRILHKKRIVGTEYPKKSKPYFF